MSDKSNSTEDPVKAEISKAIDEIHRRRRVYKNQQKKTKSQVNKNAEPQIQKVQQSTSAKSAAQKKPKVVDPDQKFALVNLSNIGHTRPGSKVPQFRLLGNFGSKMSTLKPIKRFEAKIKDCDVHRVPTKQFFLIASDASKQADAKYGPDKVTRLLALNKKNREDRNVEFEKNKLAQRKVQENLVVPQVFLDAKSPSELSAEAAKSEKENKKESKTTKEAFDAALRKINTETDGAAPLPPATTDTQKEDTKAKTDLEFPESDANEYPRELECRGQMFAVISVLPDFENYSETTVATATAAAGGTGQSPATVDATSTDVSQEKTKPDEPAIAIFATFQTKEEATDYTTDVLGSQVDDFNLYVVDMYEWAPATNLSSAKVPTKWRNDELNLIMNAQKDEQHNIAIRKQELVNDDAQNKAKDSIKK